MALYTARGDDGTTTTFGCDQRMSKSSAIAEALGVLDEANSYLGSCKVQAVLDDFNIADTDDNKQKVAKIVHEVQDDLFIIQAELAGAEKTMSQQKVKWLEEIIAEIERQLPEIHTFFISGGSELAARFDFARTVVRRAERRVVGVHDEGVIKIGKYTLAYLNRLSSLLYALARYANYSRDIREDSPDYK